MTSCCFFISQSRSNLKTLSITRCNDFIYFCEIQHKIYQPQGPLQKSNCCQEFFNMEPIFMPTGVCYTTNKEVLEKYPYEFSAIEIWANLEFPDVKYLGQENEQY